MKIHTIFAVLLITSIGQAGAMMRVVTKVCPQASRTALLVTAAGNKCAYPVYVQKRNVSFDNLGVSAIIGLTVANGLDDLAVSPALSLVSAAFIGGLTILTRDDMEKKREQYVNNLLEKIKELEKKKEFADKIKELQNKK